MDGGDCLIMDARPHVHAFLDKTTVTVLLACIFSDDILLNLMHFSNPLFSACTSRLFLSVNIA